MASVRELIARAKSYTIKVEEAVSLAYEAYKKVQTDLVYANERYREKSSPRYPTIFARSYMQALKSSPVAVEILEGAIDRAIEQNDEFSRTMYKNALYEVAKSPDIYVMTPIGTGWNTKLSVIVNLDDAAGSLQDWSRGIIGYRDELEVKLGDESSRRGLKATNWWFEHVYRESLEVVTFRSRISYAGRPAPFWQILNSGTPSGMPSDRKDGSFNPVPSVPTGFTLEAEQALAAHFNSVMTSERTQWESETRLLRIEISAANALLDEIQELINSLKADERLDEHIIQTLNSRARSGDISEYVDKDKLREAIRRHRAGEEFTTQRIELTAKNAAKRVRPRVETFIRLVEGYKEL